MRSIRSAFALLPLCLFIVGTETLAQPDGPFRRTVSVTGEAEVRVVPDEVLLTFGIETTDMDLDKARRQNDERLAQLMALVRRLSIPQERVQTSHMTVQPRYEYEPRSESRTFMGYTMNRGVSIVLRDLTKYDELLSGALKLGVTHASQADFRTTELRQHRDTARAMAARAAREKADALASELGMSVGRPITITETHDNYWPQPRGPMMQNAMLDADGGGGGESSTLALGRIVVRARVSVVFEME